MGSVTVTIHLTDCPPAEIVSSGFLPPWAVLGTVTVILFPEIVAVAAVLSLEVILTLESPVLFVRVNVPVPPIAMLRVFLSKESAPLSVIVTVQDADLSS